MSERQVWVSIEAGEVLFGVYDTAEEAAVSIEASTRAAVDEIGGRVSSVELRDDRKGSKRLEMRWLTRKLENKLVVYHLWPTTYRTK